MIFIKKCTIIIKPMPEKEKNKNNSELPYRFLTIIDSAFDIGSGGIEPYKRVLDKLLANQDLTIEEKQLITSGPSNLLSSLYVLNWGGKKWGDPPKNLHPNTSVYLNFIQYSKYLYYRTQQTMGMGNYKIYTEPALYKVAGMLGAMQQ